MEDTDSLSGVIRATRSRRKPFHPGSTPIEGRSGLSPRSAASAMSWKDCCQPGLSAGMFSAVRSLARSRSGR
jgi:hypothetical protein